MPPLPIQSSLGGWIFVVVIVGVVSSVSYFHPWALAVFIAFAIRAIIVNIQSKNHFRRLSEARPNEDIGTFAEVFQLPGDRYVDHSRGL